MQSALIVEDQLPSTATDFFARVKWFILQVAKPHERLRFRADDAGVGPTRTRIPMSIPAGCCLGFCPANLYCSTLSAQQIGSRRLETT